MMIVLSLFFSQALGSSQTLTEWFTERQAERVIYSNTVECEGFGLRFSQIEDSRMLVVHEEETGIVHNFALNGNLTKCGDMALAVKTRGMEFGDALNAAIELRSTNYSEWLAGGKIISKYSGPTEDAALDAILGISWIGFVPFKLPPEIETARLASIASDVSAQNCRGLRLEDKDAQVRIGRFPPDLETRIDVRFKGGARIEVGVYRQWQTLDCATIVAFIGNAIKDRIPQTLPKDGLILRRWLEESLGPVAKVQRFCRSVGAFSRGGIRVDCSPIGIVQYMELGWTFAESFLYTQYLPRLCEHVEAFSAELERLGIFEITQRRLHMLL
jgi:hypothetical protein